MGKVTPNKRQQATAQETVDKALEVAGGRELSTDVVDPSAWLEDAGRGMENVGMDDMSIPLIAIAQKGSPQIDKTHAKYIKGLEYGDLFNTVTGKIYKQGDGNPPLRVIPCGFERVFIEYRQRESGGGFVAAYSASEGEALLRDCHKDDKKRDCLPNGNQLVNTAQHYVVIVNDDGTWDSAVLPMTSTQLKKSRKWLTLLKEMRVIVRGQAFNPPSYSHIWDITTIGEQNPQGSWMGFKIDLLGPAPGPLYLAAKAFNDIVTEGRARAAHESAATVDVEVEENVAQGEGGVF